MVTYVFNSLEDDVTNGSKRGEQLGFLEEIEGVKCPSFSLSVRPIISPITKIVKVFIIIDLYFNFNKIRSKYFLSLGSTSRVLYP